MSTTYQRARNAILGSFVADAAAMGLHWIYDVDRVRELGGDAPEFHVPVDYHQKRKPGEFTHYGDHALVLLESLASQGGLDPHDYARRYRERFGDDAYDGYLDHATKEFLKTGKGADDNQAGAFTKLPLLAARYLNDPQMEVRVEEAIRVTHDNTQAVRYGVAAACAIRAAIRGESARDAVQAACRTSGAVGKLLDTVLGGGDDVVAFAAEHGQTCPVPNAFPVALHGALHGDAFTDSVRGSILAGGDTSGRLFVTAAIRGATDGVPEEWLARLARREDIERMVTAVLEKAGLD